MDQHISEVIFGAKDASEAILKAGDMFDGGKFRIIKHLGEGYCSQVYLAQELGEASDGSLPSLSNMKITDL
jgi:hypothetical protein